MRAIILRASTIRKIGDILRTYTFAEKMKGYGLRITGDIDDPRNFLNTNGKKMLEEWSFLASELSTCPPILFVTVIAPSFFSTLREDVKSIDEKIVVGVHGYRHVHYPMYANANDISLCKKLSDWFRFPYLDCNLELLKTVSRHFNYESSMASSSLYPYRIGAMWEYPIATPTDSYFLEMGHSARAVGIYLKKISLAKKKEKFVTFLFHPNDFTISLMSKLRRFSI